MAFARYDNGRFLADGKNARFIPCPSGQAITVSSTGATLYYKSTSDVTSSSNDGNITTGNSTTLTNGVFVICAQGAETVVTWTQTEGTTGDFRVGGNTTHVGTTTFTGTVTNTGGINAPSAVLALANVPQVGTGTQGTDTTPADGTLFLVSFVPQFNFTATGVAYLIGSVGGTDRVVVNLWNASGTNLAQSTTASNGTVCGTAANFQKIAFTSTYSVTAGTRYFVGVAAKGNTCRLRTIGAGNDFGAYYAGSVSQTHGATTAITVPSSFTADKGPIVSLYA